MRFDQFGRARSRRPPGTIPARTGGASVHPVVRAKARTAPILRRLSGAAAKAGSGT